MSASARFRSLLGPRVRSVIRPIWDAMAVPVLAVLTALVAGALLMLVTGGNPFLAYYGLLKGAFGSAEAWSETLVWTTPYIFAGLGVALAFKGGLFNIGAEGQIAVAATVTAWIGYALPGLLHMSIPAIIHAPLVIVGGALAGAIWGGIPGWLKARTGAHEVINTIMMNYIAVLAVGYLLNGPMRDPSPLNAIARTPLIAQSAHIPAIFPNLRVHYGFVVALVMAALVWWLLYKTTIGFEIRTVGINPNAAKYAGMSVAWIITLSMGLSGMLAGMAGAFEVAGLSFRHEPGFSVGYGFDAITVALLGKTHPAGVVLAAFLLGAMRNGATQMQFLTQIPVDMVSVIQALILLFVAADAIVRYIYRLGKSKEEQMVLTRGWQ